MDITQAPHGLGITGSVADGARGDKHEAKVWGARLAPVGNGNCLLTAF